MKYVLLGAVTVLLLCELFFCGSAQLLLRAGARHCGVFSPPSTLLFEAPLRLCFSSSAGWRQRHGGWAFHRSQFLGRPSAASSAPLASTTGLSVVFVALRLCWLFTGLLLLLCGELPYVAHQPCACRFQWRPW
jgi:hypothetical protein